MVFLATFVFVKLLRFILMIYEDDLHMDYLLLKWNLTNFFFISSKTRPSNRIFFLSPAYESGGFNLTICIHMIPYTVEPYNFMSSKTRSSNSSHFLSPAYRSGGFNSITCIHMIPYTALTTRAKLVNCLYWYRGMHAYQNEQ